MGVKNQFQKIKENWLVAVLLVILLIALVFVNSFAYFFSPYSDLSLSSLSSSEKYYDDVAYDSYPSSSRYYPQGGFAPEVEDRIITRAGSLVIGVSKGKYSETEAKLKDIVGNSNSIILNENVNENTNNKRSYMSGYYNIKVKTSQYDAVLNQLRKIGEVTSFRDNLRDETGSYYGIATELKMKGIGWRGIRSYMME